MTDLGRKAKGKVFIDLDFLVFFIWMDDGRDPYLAGKFINSLTPIFYYEKLQTRNSFGDILIRGVLE